MVASELASGWGPHTAHGSLAKIAAARGGGEPAQGNGIGKWAGLEGGGTTEVLAQYPDGRLSITWQGTWTMEEREPPLLTF